MTKPPEIALTALQDMVAELHCSRGLRERIMLFSPHAGGIGWSALEAQDTCGTIEARLAAAKVLAEGDL